MGIFEQLGISVDDMNEPKLEVRDGKYVLSGVHKLTTEQWQKVKDWIQAGKPYIEDVNKKK